MSKAMRNSSTVDIEGVTLHLTSPEKSVPTWVGQREVLLQLLAAWTRIEKQDLPLHPRLLGKPGVGKTTLACAAARGLGLAAYILPATPDTPPPAPIFVPPFEPA